MPRPANTDFGTVEPATLWRNPDEGVDRFRHSLNSRGVEEVIETVRRSMTTGVPTQSLSIEDLPLGRLSDDVARLREELLSGTGFAVVDGFPVEALTTDEIERFFWAVGRHLGRPVSQSVMGERLGHVRDVTKTDPHARAYRNRSELTPHTDPADLLTFLCLHPAARGGVSRFVSSMTSHEEIRRTRPDLLERLYRGYRYHRLGEEQPGSAPITPHRVPVFSVHEGHTSCRYVRLYMEVAADEDPQIEIDSVDREALDLFEQLAADPSLHVEFTLQRGEAVFANNFTVMHARSSFENDPNQPARHLLRLWLAADPSRPVTPNILHYDGEPGIQPIEGRKPSYATNVDVQ